MLIRLLALALLLATTQAQAAPKKHKPAPTQETTTTPETIDVDAMARAKDAAAGDSATQTPAAVSDKPAEASAAQTETPKDDAAAASPKTEPSSAEPAPAEPAAAKSEAASVGVPPLLAPTPDDAEQRLAAACEARATSLLDAAQKGDYASATKDFDAKMRTSLPVPKFKQAWDSLAQFGPLTARGQVHSSKGEGYFAIMIPLLFEKANLYAEVACGSDGRIAGFYVKPVEGAQQ